MRVLHKPRLKNWIVLLIFGLLAFISGTKFNFLFGKKNIAVETVDVNKYETDFGDVSRLLSQNTLAVYGIAEAVTNSWIKSLALGQDSAGQIGEVFSKLENTGAKEALIEKNEKIEEGMRILKLYPLKYMEAYKVLEDVYALYSQFYKFALTPEGSLMIYSQKISEFEGDLAKSFNKLILYAPKIAQHAVDKSPSPIKIEAILGMTLEEVEKIMGSPQSEAWAYSTDDYQREYYYNGQKVRVYYKKNLVTGLSN